MKNVIFAAGLLVTLAVPAIAQQDIITSFQTVKSCTFSAMDLTLPRSSLLGSLLKITGDPRNWQRVEITETTLRYQDGRIRTEVSDFNLILMIEPTADQRAGCLPKDEFDARFESYFRKLAEAITQLR